MLLEIVYTESSAEKLHSNEMKAVCEALRGLFTNLQSSESCTSLTGNLYLLGRDDRRHKASTLICGGIPQYFVCYGLYSCRILTIPCKISLQDLHLFLCPYWRHWAVVTSKLA